MNETSMEDETETFKLTFTEEYRPNDILNFGNIPVKTTSAVTHKYGRWYHKIMYYLTFKIRFVESYEYEVEMIDT